MRRRKYISIIIALLLAISAIALTSCGTAEADAKKSEKNKAETSASAEKQSEDALAEENAGGSSGNGSGGSSGGSATGGGSASTEYCYVTIEGYCSEMAIALQGGDTIYSVSARTGAAFSGSSSYITGINGRMEKSEGASSGWIYTLNGGQVWKAANACTVSAGDSVSWSFVK